MKTALTDIVYSDELLSSLRAAWDLSRSRFGNCLTVYIPGMFVVDGCRGKYRAVSITGTRCALDCEHCKGLLLHTMPSAQDADALVRLGLEAHARGDRGILVTGGCDDSGKLPWEQFLPAIRALKQSTDLTVTVHAGQVDFRTAAALKDAGVDQALVDVMGDDDTVRDVYHLPGGTGRIRRTLEALATAGLVTVPHILFGIHYGEVRGETRALQILKAYCIDKYVVVVIMPFRNTPMAGISVPEPARVAHFLAQARLELPHARASLGCARPRGRYRHEVDLLAVRAGINSLALPSEPALTYAEQNGLEVVYRQTCCSLD